MPNHSQHIHTQTHTHMEPNTEFQNKLQQKYLFVSNCHRKNTQINYSVLFIVFNVMNADSLLVCCTNVMFQLRKIVAAESTSIYHIFKVR